MTNEEREHEASEEEIEDLEAPAAAQRDVAGGLDVDAAKGVPMCQKKPHATKVGCDDPTCVKGVSTYIYEE